jgi:hypothetical protein
MSTICMKIDPGMHIGLHLVFFGKTGVTIDLWHQQPHSNDTNMIHLVPTDYVREISSGTSSVTDMKCTTHHRPIWEPL